MNSKDYIALAERDAVVLDALSSSLRTMRVINGRPIELSGQRQFLRLEEQMFKVHEALLRLGIDSNEIQ